MRNTLALVALVLSLGAAAPAHAFGKFGARLGTGLSFVDVPSGADEPTITPIVAGLAWKIDIIAIALEIDALWVRNSVDKPEGHEDRLAFPVIGKFSFPLIPLLFSLDVGAGLEPRFLIGADPSAYEDNLESMVLYLPITLGGTLDLQLLELNLDLRYERQLTNHAKGPGADDVRVHQLLFLAGVFF